MKCVEACGKWNILGGVVISFYYAINLMLNFHAEIQLKRTRDKIPDSQSVLSQFLSIMRPQKELCNFHGYISVGKCNKMIPF